ncbi:MAG: protein phosphatase 2C domain-containing protein [Aestuariivirga sp.]
MRLVGAVTEGSGAVNEDGWGYAGTPDHVTAAWVFDGVTGINARNYLPSGTDAAWLVAQAHGRLRDLAGKDMPLQEILLHLMQALIDDWHHATTGVEIPEDYDPPAACLVLVKRYGKSWKALRLGDSCLLAGFNNGAPAQVVASPSNVFDDWLSAEARKRRDAGVFDVKALLAEFRPQLKQSRAARNTPKGYGILEANPAATRFAEYFELGAPQTLLLCTDGYYRAVDHYNLHSDASLLTTSLEAEGIDRVLRDMRALEASDPTCKKYLRFKPADDATAVMLHQMR